MEDLTDGVQSVFKQLVTEADWLTNATKVRTFCETLTSLFHCYILLPKPRRYYVSLLPGAVVVGQFSNGQFFMSRFWQRRRLTPSSTTSATRILSPKRRNFSWKWKE